MVFFFFNSKIIKVVLKKIKIKIKIKNKKQIYYVNICKSIMSILSTIIFYLYT